MYRMRGIPTLSSPKDVAGEDDCLTTRSSPSKGTRHRGTTVFRPEKKSQKRVQDVDTIRRPHSLGFNIGVGAAVIFGILGAVFAGAYLSQWQRRRLNSRDRSPTKLDLPVIIALHLPRISSTDVEKWRSFPISSSTS